MRDDSLREPVEARGCSAVPAAIELMSATNVQVLILITLVLMFVIGCVREVKGKVQDRSRDNPNGRRSESWLYCE
jgi:hypothetical protein